METDLPLNFRDLSLTFEDLVDPRRTALVMWDFQKGLAGKASNLATLKPNALALLDAAEKAGVMDALSQHTFPPLDQVTGPWLTWMMRRQDVTRPQDLKPLFQEGSEDVEWLDGFQPLPHHPVLKKQQPSLFFNTPFDHHLRIMNIRRVVVAGFATDIGVEFTVRHGNALGYHTLVVADACGAYTQVAHDESLNYLRRWANTTHLRSLLREWDN